MKRILCLALLAMPALAQIKPSEVSETVVPYEINVDLRDLPILPQWQPGDPIKEIPKVRRGKPMPYEEPNLVDPLLDRDPRSPSNPDLAFDTPTLNFDGIGFTGPNPPDTVGDVGVNYYIQAVNAGGGTSYTIFNKSDGTVAAGPLTLSDLGTGSCGSGLGDPIVMFDRLAMRWVISEFPSDFSARFCVYVAQTADPIAGGWFAYDFPATNFPDYPKYGVWPDAYYVTSNENSPRVYAFDRANMLVGNPATRIQFNLTDLAGFGFQTATPADLTGLVPPPANAPGIIMRHRDDEVHNSGSNDPGQDFIELYEANIDWVTPGNSTLDGPQNIAVAEFDSSLCGLTSFNCFPQPSSGTTLDPLREVIMFRLQYRNLDSHQAIVGNFVTDVDGNDTGGIRWFELRNTGSGWSLFQEGTFSPDNVNRWMAGISIDASGNIAMAYNVSDATVTFPGLRYVGRLVDDPVGTMPQGEFNMVDGSSPNSSNRYGDYSSMSIDPVDDCTFWFTGEYNVATTWSTRIAAFRFDACGCEPPDTPTNLTAMANGDNQIDLAWDTVAGAESYSVYRRVGGCGSGFELIQAAIVGTTFSDTDVSGGSTYGYAVRAYDLTEDCLSSNSDCASATATGDCLLPPTDTTITAVVNPQEMNCVLDLSWSAGATTCGTGLVYNIYRSETPGFTPGPGNLIASCVPGTSYQDTDVSFGTTYYYIVRAEDQTGDGSGPCASGNEDSNTTELSGSPTGPDQVEFEDDMESGTGNWMTAALPGDTGTSPWAQVTSASTSPTHSWFCSDEPVVKDQVVQLLAPIALPAGGGILEFQRQTNTENNWDGVVLEYSLDNITWVDILAGTGGVPANADRFLQNGYDDNLNTGANPIGGRPAWNGNSGGFGLVQVNMADMAGEAIYLRWRMGCDASVGSTGFWFDDLRLFSGSECHDECLFMTQLPSWPDFSILDLLGCTFPTR